MNMRRFSAEEKDPVPKGLGFGASVVNPEPRRRSIKVLC